MDENTSDQVNWMFVSQGRPWDPELDPDKESDWRGFTAGPSSTVKHHTGILQRGEAKAGELPRV